jgi:hypothetical protein
MMMLELLIRSSRAVLEDEMLLKPMTVTSDQEYASSDRRLLLLKEVSEGGRRTHDGPGAADPLLLPGGVLEAPADHG